MDDVTRSALATAERLRTALLARRPEIEKQESYHRGAQPLAYASEEWSRSHKARYAEFADNWCGVVGSAPSERLAIQNFSLAADDVVTDAEKRLWRDWLDNEGPALSSQGFLSSTISKRSYSLVWGDRSGEPVLSWESPSQAIVDEDPETGEYRSGLKLWSDGDTEYMTLYMPDFIWKWERAASWIDVNKGRTKSGLIVPLDVHIDNGWKPRQGSDDTWPLRNPLGEVPLTEWANRPMLGGEPMSDIDATMPMQDAVNLLWAYLFVAADHASMPARVVMGQEPPKVPKFNDKGEKIGEIAVDTEKLKQGRMLWLTGQNTKIDSWDAAKLDVFTDVVQVAVKHVAAQTRTPIYLIHGELGNVNGETLTGLDAPLVSKVGEAQKFYNRPAKRTFRHMALVRNQTDVARATRGATVQWRDAATHSPQQISDAASKDRALGMSLSTVLEKRYGFTEPEIARELDRIQRENTDPYLAAARAKDDAVDDPEE